MKKVLSPSSDTKMQLKAEMKPAFSAANELFPPRVCTNTLVLPVCNNRAPTPTHRESALRNAVSE